MNDLFGIGFARLAKFAKYHQQLVNEYYDDPEYQEVKLNQRMVQMGFAIGTDGRIFGLIGEDGAAVRADKLPEGSILAPRKE